MKSYNDDRTFKFWRCDNRPCCVLVHTTIEKELKRSFYLNLTVGIFIRYWSFSTDRPFCKMYFSWNILYYWRKTFSKGHFLQRTVVYLDPMSKNIFTHGNVDSSKFTKKTDRTGDPPFYVTCLSQAYRLNDPFPPLLSYIHARVYDEKKGVFRVTISLDRRGNIKAIKRSKNKSRK